MYCHNCGKSISPESKFCRYCGVEVTSKAISRKSQIKKNRYDEGVKEWFTSRTFRTILLTGLFFGCCYAVISFSLLGSLIGFVNDLLPTVSPIPYVVRDAGRNALDPEIEAAINMWLVTDSPSDAPYYFVTYWQKENDDRYLVSLAAVNLSSPDEDWTLVNDVNPDDNKVVWIGTVEVYRGNVRLYP